MLYRAKQFVSKNVSKMSLKPMQGLFSALLDEMFNISPKNEKQGGRRLNALEVRLIALYRGILTILKNEIKVFNTKAISRSVLRIELNGRFD